MLPAFFVTLSSKPVSAFVGVFTNKEKDENKI